MRRKGILKTLVLVAAVLWMAAAASADCVSMVPDEIYMGESACFEVCAGGAYAPWLIGHVQGLVGYPVLVMQPGCDAVSTFCDYECEPPCDPPTTWIPDPDYPNCYYAESACVFLYLCFAHDSLWTLEVYPNQDGCFCVTFDHQLAVELSAGLAATPGDNQVTLTWATASESNNDRFEILRDDRAVASVNGMGNSPVGQTYRWVDADAQNGVLYTYKLVSVDLQGQREVLGTASATPSPAAAATVTEYALYQNYPNPFNPTTSIVFDVVESAPVLLRVFNPMGEAVATLVNSNIGTGRHTVQFDASQFTSGLYFYHIAIGDQYTATRKMLLVK